MNFVKRFDSACLELAKELKDVEIVSRAFCCTTCTLAEVEKDYYIVWKIFESGMNKNIDYYVEENGKEKELCGAWYLTEEQMEKAIEILSKYFEVEKPIDDTKCITIKGV